MDSSSFLTCTNRVGGETIGQLRLKRDGPRLDGLGTMLTKLHPELRRICRRRWSALPSSHRWLKPESRWAFSACQGSGSLFYPALPNLSASTPASGSLGSPLICRTVSKSDTFVIASQHLQIDFAGCRPASRSRSNNEAQGNGNAPPNPRPERASPAGIRSAITAWVERRFHRPPHADCDRQTQGPDQPTRRKLPPTWHPIRSRVQTSPC